MSFCLFDGTGDVATSDLTTAITGDLDVRAKIRAVDWTPMGTSASITGQYGTYGNRNYRLYLSEDGALVFVYVVANAAVAKGSTVVLSGVTDNVTDLWVRVVHDVDNGAAGNNVLFYTSTNGTDWTQLGNTVTTAGTVARDNIAYAHEVGASTGGATNVWNGRIYSAEIRSGIDGTIVANPAFDASPWDKGETVNDDTSSTTNTWTLTGAIISADAWTLTGAAVSAATVAAGLKLGHPLAGASVIDAATVAGSLKLSRQLAGATSSSSTVVSALKLGHQLAGASLDVSTVSSALKLGHTLAGAATSTTIVDASLKLLHQLVGAVTGSASVAGSLDLHLIHLLLGAATSNSAAAGALKLLHQLYGNPALTSQVAARLTVYGNIGSATIAETLQGLATIVETGPN